MISGLACEGHHRADHGDFVAKPFVAHRAAGANRAVRAEGQNALQVRVGFDDVERRFVGGVDLVGAWETVGDELHVRIVRLLVGDRRVGPDVVERRGQRADKDGVFALLAHFFGQLLHLHLAEGHGIDELDVPSAALLLGALMGDDRDAGLVGALQHRLSHLHVDWHQADHVDLLGDEVF